MEKRSTSFTALEPANHHLRTINRVHSRGERNLGFPHCALLAEASPEPLPVSTAPAPAPAVLAPAVVVAVAVVAAVAAAVAVGLFVCLFVCLGGTNCE